MSTNDIVIIGAGAAGLMACRTLAKSGKKVTVLEARDRIGGRIHTLQEDPFSEYVELGAEFIHGKLPVTLGVLIDAGIGLTPAGGEMWRLKNGKFSRGFGEFSWWDALMQKLGTLEADTTMGDFLNRYFAGDQYDELRESVTRYVSGYDTADIYKVSAFALRDEWQGEDDSEQHRVKGGYGIMIDYLAGEASANGAEIVLNAVVTDIDWDQQRVKIVTADGRTYPADKAVIALPLGVLQTKDKINFYPATPEYTDAACRIGFGAIIKVLLEFTHAFWKGEEATSRTGQDMSEMSFIISDEALPTWWTQFPQHSNVLTGWFGGPPAEKQKHLSSEELLGMSLQSLSNIFRIGKDQLKSYLKAWRVVNWTTDPYTLGSYVYDMVESHSARKILSEPISNRLYFAGEYLYEGPAMGTVEAALSSGLAVANKLM